MGLRCLKGKCFPAVQEESFSFLKEYLKVCFDVMF